MVRVPALGLCGLVAFLLQFSLQPVLWPASAEEARFDASSLKALLQKNPVTGLPVDSIDELVPLLPQELRANFTFVYDSRSPFRSSISLDYPRVILFTPDARLVLTFTADPHKPGFNVLESLSFDDSAAKFELHAYPLPAARRQGWNPSAETSNCASCHGADSRPIFDSYPIWPGFYGSVLDTFSRDGPGETEAANYRKFLAGTARTEPYKYLTFPSGSSVTPYLDPHNESHDAPEIDASNMRLLPNTRLGMALTELNRARVYRKLAEGKDFKANEKHLLADLLDCRHAGVPTPEDRHIVEQQLRRENDARLRRLGLPPGDPHSRDDDMQELQFVPELAEIVRVARQAGADRSDWSMALEPGSLAFFDGILSGTHDGRSYYLKEDLIFELLGNLARREPAFRRYFATEAVFADLGYPFGTRIVLGKALRSCRLLARG